MSGDNHEDIAVKLAAVLRDLHTRIPDLVEAVCDEHGVDIDWDDEPQGGAS